MKIIINGRFLAQTITGVQRYALEITRELDGIIKPSDEWEIYVPHDAEINFRYKNIKIVFSTKKAKSILWDHLDYDVYVKKQNGLSLNLCNNISLFSPSIVCIHDVTYKANPQMHCETFKDVIRLVWNRFKLNISIKRALTIITVSNFSKSEIIKYYNYPKEKIIIASSAWEHINRIIASKDVFSSRYTFLQPGKYYFSLSTLAANKNFRWIIYAAKNNPGSVFAIAGGGNLKGAAEEQGFINLPNVHFLGYISDEDAKALMKNCQAFLFPTLYEGFGLTPLEAIASGAERIIVSDTPCMHEIYGDYASYISPYDFNCIIEQVPPAKNLNIKEILKKYSFRKSAEKVKTIAEKIRKEL